MYRPTQHYSNEELPIILNFLEDNGIKYTVRKLKTSSELCNSIHMEFEEYWINDALWDLTKLMRKG